METAALKIKNIRDKCLANAEASLSVAERELDKGADHICFHLALLALEEIGKAILVTIVHTVSVADRDKGNLSIAMDDHVKKIFWALWGGMFRDNKFTKESIEQNRELAATLHERRLYYLYTDPNNPTDPSKRIKEGEAKRLVELTRARLELEKLTEVNNKFNEEDAKDLKWFFKATEDIDKRKYIFGNESLKKLEEFKDGKEWMKWLMDVFQKNEEEMRKLAEQELRRQKPSETEAFQPKYKMRIRIQTPSHSVTNNAFSKWNEGTRDIKIYKSDRKDVRRLTKSEIIIDFTFPKALPMSGLWDHGFFMAKTLVIALNIATKGLFWWNVPKDVDKFYEEITDLEADKNGNVKVRVTVGKRLAIDWGKQMVLDQEEMGRVSTIAAFLMREHKKLEDFLKTYAFALVLFSKIDIHLRLEVNAFDEFFKAFKFALRTFGDWDGKSDLKEAIMKQFTKLDQSNEFEQTINLGIALNKDVERKKIHNITLTEIAAIKLYCDFYIQLKAAEYFQNLKEAI